VVRRRFPSVHLNRRRWGRRHVRACGCRCHDHLRRRRRRGRPHCRICIGTDISRGRRIGREPSGSGPWRRCQQQHAERDRSREQDGRPQ